VLSGPDGQKLGQRVEVGSEFVVIASKYADGNLYYEISNGKWIMAKYTTQEAQVTAKSGVLTINSKPDYGVPVWRVPGQDQISGKFLKDGSSCRYFRVANVNGQTWYDLGGNQRSEEHTSELQSRFDLVCRLMLEKKNNKKIN